MRVLLAVHEGNLRNRLGTLLRAQGHQVLVASEGEEALHVLQKSIVHLVVASVMVGRMRIVEFAIAAKGVRPRTPIVVTGGYFGPNPIIPFIDAVVQEPVSLRDVAQVANTLLASVRKKDGAQHLASPYGFRKRTRRLKKNGTGT